MSTRTHGRRAATATVAVACVVLLLWSGARTRSQASDRKFHAFDSRAGELLWETLLTYAGNATRSRIRPGNGSSW